MTEAARAARESRIGLGTVQFGSDYGITNRAGQVSAGEVGAILDLALGSGVDTIDTARNYGTSETVLGDRLPPRADVRIVTKTPRFGETSDPGTLLRTSFSASQQALRRKQLFALLIHNARDLLGPGGPAIWSALEKLKDAGLVTRIGVSTYEPADVDIILDRYPIDIIQLPFNAIDDRLVEGGQLERLARAGVEIHARSVFLQGLLLQPADRIESRFAPVRSAVEQLDAHFGSCGLTRLEGLLALAFGRAEIARFIVGATSTSELDAILRAAARVAKVSLQRPNLPTIDGRYLNPARWSELV